MAILEQPSRDLTYAGQALIAARRINADADTVLSLVARISDKQLITQTVGLLGTIASTTPHFLTSLRAFIRTHDGHAHPLQHYAVAINTLASNPNNLPNAV
mgnify:CR=1 FL=1